MAENSIVLGCGLLLSAGQHGSNMWVGLGYLGLSILEGLGHLVTREWHDGNRHNIGDTVDFHL